MEKSKLKKIVQPSIKYTVVQDNDPEFGVTEEYKFEIFKRPYFFGLIGKKRWEFLIQTNDFNLGYSFSMSQIPKNKI